MRKFIPLFIIILAMGASLAFYFMNDDDDQTNKDYISEKRILELANSPSERLEFVYDIKKDPVQVMRVYNIIRKLIYSQEPDEKNLESLLNLQRLLYHPSLLDQNQKDLHLNAVQSDIAKWQEANLWLLGSDMLSPIYHTTETHEVCGIKVVYYTNIENTAEQDNDLYVIFELIRDENGHWDILAWGRTDPFDIVK